ncbi:MAG: hypothetical protein LC708_00505, partial [Actinobacteria bacterium]|nr:hypothetical protein [Actinomycetota bacterium]
RVELDVGGEAVVLVAGRLVGSPGQLPLGDDGEEADPAGPLPRHLVDELTCVASWIDGEGRRARLLHCEEGWASPLPPLPRYNR